VGISVKRAGEIDKVEWDRIGDEATKFSTVNRPRPQ
jgi:hypothetical protein